MMGVLQTHSGRQSKVGDDVDRLQYADGVMWAGELGPGGKDGWRGQQKKMDAGWYGDPEFDDAREKERVIRAAEDFSISEWTGAQGCP